MYNVRTVVPPVSLFFRDLNLLLNQTYLKITIFRNLPKHKRSIHPVKTDFIINLCYSHSVMVDHNLLTMNYF
jgi:hypothetical protein